MAFRHLHFVKRYKDMPLTRSTKLWNRFEKSADFREGEEYACMEEQLGNGVKVDYVIFKIK